MSEDVLGVLESLGHLGVVAFKCMSKRQGLTLVLFIDVGYKAIL